MCSLSCVLCEKKLLSLSFYFKDGFSGRNGSKYLAEISANSVFSRDLYLSQRTSGRIRWLDFLSAWTSPLTVLRRFCHWNLFSMCWATHYTLRASLLISRGSQKIRNYQKWDLTNTFYFPIKFIEWTIRPEIFKSELLRKMFLPSSKRYFCL